MPFWVDSESWISQSVVLQESADKNMGGRCARVSDFLADHLEERTVAGDEICGLWIFLIPLGNGERRPFWSFAISSSGCQ